MHPNTEKDDRQEQRSYVSPDAPKFLGLTGRPLSLVVSIIATTGFLLFGYDQGVMSGIISAAPFNNYFPETKGNTTWQGFVTAIYEVGKSSTFLLLCDC